MREASQTPKLDDHPGAKNSIVWQYFGLIKAKDEPVAKSNIVMIKGILLLYINHV